MSHMQSAERNNELRVPSWRLREEAEKKRAAIARAEAAEKRVLSLRLP
jgi:hypothetical protein